MPAEFGPFDKAEWLRLEKKADELRRLTIQTAIWGGSGHLGGALSAIDIMTILYYRFMKLDPNDPNFEDRDRFVLSKGHAAVGYAPVLVDYGYMPIEELKIFNLTGAKIGMHLDSNKVKGVDFSTGSLGHGISLGVGSALAARFKGKDYMTYVLCGDGEMNEGSNWEGIMSAAQFNLSNLVIMIDNNKCMIDGRVADEMNIEPLDKKLRAFNCNTYRIDGHDMSQLNAAIEAAIDNAKKGTKPTAIVLDTFKGEGVDFMKDNYLWHYGSLDDEKIEKCYASLDAYYRERCARAQKEGK
ncbi:MAG: transketolase [Clostridia bacterium]|nr:transketolase [Clostridia bacterium]MBR5977301.1 transketolase [Clostridia bacterium]MBR5991634.1 transketolase [Clostridia bacterium]MBR6479798.1 transketolase [Clostridia bacterium]MBR6513017.1 transketolase [Clostridia bacterium]